MLEKIILEVLFQEPCHCISDDSEPTDNTDQFKQTNTARRNEETGRKIESENRFSISVTAKERKVIIQSYLSETDYLLSFISL